MKRSIVLIGVLEVALFGQTPPADIPQTTIRVATHMVVVDVIVSDKAGNAVTGLQSTDFSVNEDGKAQKIAAFRFETPRPAESRSLPTLPPHIYTNRTGYKAPAGPVTIIVLDGINTALRDQMYARQQLLKYLKTQLKPNQHIAVFVLTGQLHLLQDIDSDPELLLSKVEHFLAQDPRNLSIEQESMQPFRRISSATPDQGVGFREFQGMMLERGAVAYDARVSETLAAFRTIASAVGGYSGRKNLIWISSAFPSVFMADSSISANGAQRIFLDSSMHAEARVTSQRLAQAQIAVYPVDPRGLVGAAVEDASRDLKDPWGHSYAGGDFAQQMNRSNSGLLGSQGTMEEFANETGGVAYMNQNEISHAVALSVADGSSYYSLAYYPGNKDWNERFRSIQVKVGRSDVRLRYRRGYYAADALVSPQKGKGKTAAEADLGSALQGEFVGATSVVFDARVVPPAPAPSARVPVDFLVNTDTVSYEPTANGGRHYLLDFHVSAFAADGKLATHVDKTFEATAIAADYERVRQHGLPLQTSLDLPAGHYQLRLIIRDSRTGLLGSMEFPLELSQAATGQ
jgi:VWFA-related protein